MQAVGLEKNNIVIVRDADQPILRTAVAEFVERIEKAGPDAVAFLYYSGHGTGDRTDRGENYLIPVGAKIKLAKQLPMLGVSLSEITKSMERVPGGCEQVQQDLAIRSTRLEAFGARSEHERESELARRFHGSGLMKRHNDTSPLGPHEVSWDALNSSATSIIQIRAT